MLRGFGSGSLAASLSSMRLSPLADLDAEAPQSTRRALPVTKSGHPLKRCLRRIAVHRDDATARSAAIKSAKSKTLGRYDQPQVIGCSI